jgi:hypothetical protein
MKKLTLLLTILLNFISFTQINLSGFVTDENNEKLPFVNVYSINNNKGTITNIDGFYKINLPKGISIIKFSYIGYISDSILVNIEDYKEYNLNIILKEKTKTTSEVLIFATKVTDTELSVIEEIKSSNQVINAVSSEMIKKTGDSDASEIVRRIPGVTVFNNNYIMIRGLNERYNNVLLHDIFAPSMEPDVRSFSFDIIPSNMIDRIIIYKSPSPEITGDFSGGLVKIYTKNIPDNNFTSISYSNSYRSGTTFGKFKQPDRTSLHWIGFNDGFNNLPNLPNNLSVISNSNDLNQYGKEFNNSWIPIESIALPDLNFSFTHGHKLKYDKIDIGNITSITYNNSKSLFISERNDFNAYDFINDKSNFIYKFSDNIYTQNIRTSILHNWSFRFNSNNSIDFKNMFNIFSETEYINRTGYDYEFNYSPSNHSFKQVYRGIYSTQLMGKHISKNERSILNWTIGLGYSYRDQPDYRRYRSDIDTVTGHTQLFVGVPISPNYLGRFFSKMRENNQTINLLFTSKLTNKSLLKTGFFIDRKYRDFAARNLGFVQSDFMNFDQNLLNLTINELFSSENINSLNGIKIAESTNPSDSYKANNLLLSGFFGIETQFLKRFNLNTGVRTEFNHQKLYSRLISGTPVIVDNPIISLLPSINLTYKITNDDKFLSRFSYGKTINRPEFRELAPFAFYDFNFNLVKKGSDSLKTPTIHNFDFRLDYYPNPGEMITVSFFYKIFNNPIETLFIPGGGSGGIKTFTFGNANLAISKGVEIEIRKSLSGLIKKTSILDDISLMFNSSFIQSQVELGLEQLGQSNKRPLQGQSPYIINLGIFYKSKSDISINMIYNVIGPRIFIIGFDVYPDIYEMPRNVIDINISKKIKNNIEFKIGLKDLLNQEISMIQDANRNGKLEKMKDQTILKYKPGTQFSLGFVYSF